jgi:hypothetical protein
LKCRNLARASLLAPQRWGACENSSRRSPRCMSKSREGPLLPLRWRRSGRPSRGYCDRTFSSNTSTPARRDDDLEAPRRPRSGGGEGTAERLGTLRVGEVGRTECERDANRGGNGGGFARGRNRNRSRGKKLDGRDGRIRTGGPLLPKQMRYQAAPRPDADLWGPGMRRDAATREARRRSSSPRSGPASLPRGG